MPAADPAGLLLVAEQSLCLVAAMDRERAIGWRGGMPWHLPADLQHFKAITHGHAVVMGRRTWESLPAALPGRHNIVLSSRLDYAARGADVCNSLQSALAMAGNGTIMIIGGAQLYRLCLPHASSMELTLLDTTLEQADTWFPPWDEADWDMLAQHHRPADAGNAYAMTFVSLQRVSAQARQ
jgi:dihydrofolate reductase